MRPSRSDSLHTRISLPTFHVPQMRNHRAAAPTKRAKRQRRRAPPALAMAPVGPVPDPAALPARAVGPDGTGIGGGSAHTGGGIGGSASATAACGCVRRVSPPVWLPLLATGV